MKKYLKHTSAIFFLFSFVTFFLWDRSNANGFWWTGFISINACVFAGSLMAVLEKGWVRFFRILFVIGVGLNSLVVTTNGGRMPVMFYETGRVITGAWKAATPSDHFSWFCDRFPIGNAILSAGDFLLIASLIAIVIISPRYKA